MISRFQPDHVFHLACIFIVIAGGLVTSGPAFGQTYDWLSADGPEGGGVACLAEAPNGDIYAGFWSSGGVFRSTDQGSTWQVTGLPFSTVNSLVVNNAGVVFAGLDNGEVHRSPDNGTTWTAVAWGTVGNFGAMAYDPDQDILFAARYESCSHSIDGGLTWVVIDVDFPASQVRALAVVPGLDILYAGTSADKVFTSSDGGVNWGLFDAGLTANGVYDFLIVPEGYVYAATYGGGINSAQWDDPSWTALGSGIGDGFCLAIGRDSAGSLWAGTYSMGTYVSHNDGLNWAAAHTGIEMMKISDFLFPGGGDYLTATEGGGVYRSTNGGATWAPSNSGVNRTSVNSMCTTGSGAIFAGVRGGGVHRSMNDGATWEPVNDGMVDPAVSDVVSHPDGDLFCGTLYTHIYRSTNNGDLWSETIVPPVLFRVGCLAVKPSTGDLFVGDWSEEGVWRSPDKGATWLPARGGLPVDGLRQLLVEDDGDILAVTKDSGIYRTEDDGTIWTPINNGLPVLYVNQVCSLPGGVLFVAISGHGLYRTIDDGGNWELVDSSLNEVYLNSVAANTQGTVFAGGDYDGRVFQSSDGGDTWVEISGYFPRARITEMTFTSSGQLLAGTQGFGVIYTAQTTPVQLRDLTAERSASGAVSVRWSMPSAGSIPGIHVFRSVAGAAREQVTFGPQSGGTAFEFIDTEAPTEPCDYWLRVTDSTGTESWYGPVSVGKADPFVSGLAIESVWPNPAPGITTVRFSIPVNQTARLDVYDLRGRLVRRLGQEAGGSGSLEAVWDACDDRGVRVASGTYFLRLSTDSRVVTGKMVVLGNQR